MTCHGPDTALTGSAIMGSEETSPTFFFFGLARFCTSRLRSYSRKPVALGGNKGNYVEVVGCVGPGEAEIAEIARLGDGDTVKTEPDGAVLFRGNGSGRTSSNLILSFDNST